MSQRIADLAVSDSGFVFDPRTGDVFTVNATGRTILMLLKDGFDLEQIIEHLHNEHTVDDDVDVGRDVDEFLSVLRDYGLLPAARHNEDRP
jgi:hypothetical protein